MRSFCCGSYGRLCQSHVKELIDIGSRRGACNTTNQEEKELDTGKGFLGGYYIILSYTLL